MKFTYKKNIDSLQIEKDEIQSNDNETCIRMRDFVIECDHRNRRVVISSLHTESHPHGTWDDTCVSRRLYVDRNGLMQIEYETNGYNRDRYKSKDNHDGWFPIHTAPKDGTHVILCRKGFDSQVHAYYEPDPNNHLRENGWLDAWNGTSVSALKATHWKHISDCK